MSFFSFTKKRKERLIRDIIKIESGWFSSLNTSDYRCQHNPRTFVLMRKINFETWSLRTLSLYLDFLKKADKEGRNLMAEKYLIMSGELKVDTSNLLIERIVEVERRWLDEVKAKYPGLLSEDSEKFTKYLEAELSTFPENVVRSYYSDTVRAYEKGLNLVEKRYEKMASSLGLPTIEDLIKSKK